MTATEYNVRDRTTQTTEILMSNPLEDLGLNLGEMVDPIIAPTEAKQAGSAATAGGAAAVAPAAADRAPRVEVEVGEIEVEEAAVEALPALTRGGAASGGSKYPFDRLVAPVKQADGLWGYSSFTVRLQDGVDEDALKRSVQSANTQANSKYKAEGKKFVTRSINEGGKFVAMKVFRVDGTLDGAE